MATQTLAPVPMQPLQFFPSGAFAQLLKGRGAVSSPEHRFAKQTTARDDETKYLDAATPTPTRTVVTREHARSIVSTNESPDLPFELSLNPYRGCEHGCVYCYARPSHGYLGMSPGLDFETKLSAKVNAAELLQAHISSPRYECSPIHLGANTDCYQPIEREWKLTRAVLQVLANANHPLTITTKSSLVERDLDLLAAMAQKNLVSVMISVTSLDNDLSRIMEPRATAPWRRIETIKRLAQAGVPVGVSVAPLIPFVNEPELEKILEASAQAGASSAHYTVVRMPWEVKQLMADWLHVHFPDRAARVLARIHEMRGGKANDPRFGSRMKGQGIWADMVRMRFQAGAKRNGLLNGRPVLDSSQFVRPLKQSIGQPRRQEVSAQASLF
jgi:DNA repair photolyase